MSRRRSAAKSTVCAIATAGTIAARHPDVIVPIRRGNSVDDDQSQVVFRFLPKNVAARAASGVNPKSITHGNLTDRYYKDVAREIKKRHSKEEIEGYLADLRAMLLDGSYPQDWTTVAK